MSERAWLIRYIAWALVPVAGAEWLLGRTVSRLAAAPPLEGTPRAVVEMLGRIGISLLSPAFILALALFFLSLVEAGDRLRRTLRYNRTDLALIYYLFVYGAFLLAHAALSVLVEAAVQSWLVVTINLLSFISIWWLALRFSVRSGARAEQSTHSAGARLGVLLIAVAYTGWLYYVAQQEMPVLAAGAPGAGLIVRDAGELAAVTVPFALFAAVAVPMGQWRVPKRWILPVVLVVLFAAANIADIVADQGFTGVFTSWSVGLTLYLPWPLYAASLALFTYSVLTCFARTPRERRAEWANPDTGVAMLLLLFAGYYLQLTYQHLLAVLSLMLFTEVARPLLTYGARPVRGAGVAGVSSGGSETGTHARAKSVAPTMPDTRVRAEGQ